MSSLRQRVPTGIAFIIVMIAGLFFSTNSMVLLFLLVNLLAIYEYQTLIELYPVNRHHTPIAERLLLCLVSGFIYILVAGAALGMIPSNMMAATIPIVFGLFIKELFAGASSPFVRLSLNLTGVFYITLPLALVSVIANFDGVFYPERILGIMGMVWLNDTGAYFAGRTFGKTPLFKRVSPNKTWEGSIGGAITVMITAVLAGMIFPYAFSPSTWLGIGIITAIFGGIGDLIESLLKRSLGVKDSGNLLPGHGGILDRFDAFIFTIPFIFAFISLFGI